MSLDGQTEMFAETSEPICRDAKGSKICRGDLVRRKSPPTYESVVSKLIENGVKVTFTRAQFEKNPLLTVIAIATRTTFVADGVSLPGEVIPVYLGSMFEVVKR